MFGWFTRGKKPLPADPAYAPHRTWELSAAHTTTERARIFAELAFADFANDRHGMTERAAFRIADAMQKYEVIDEKGPEHA